MKRFVYLLVLIAFASCSKKIFKEKWTNQKAPEVFRAKFETTQGDFVIVAKREWSPQGVDRLYQLLKNGFYKDIAVFRVVPMGDCSSCTNRGAIKSGGILLSGIFKAAAIASTCALGNGI